ncbi:serine hydrolase domain-containing protein [Streptomyces sp. BI20]|uniref:serine hydrolase domain-containing protein n=1 Tax=Streptomyces sp. BI20 TaxID=3403460 RepID=UPI003C7342C5
MSTITTHDRHDRPDLREIIEDMAASGFTGVTLRLLDEHGEWTAAAGLTAPGGTEPPPIDGHVRVGSVTKPLTAAAVLRLVAEGALTLDAPAAGHLPGLGLDPRVTTRMLLQHTSGVFNFTGEYHEDGTFTPGIPATTAGRAWVDHRFTTYRPAELARFALARPARFEPGTDWSYSNTNYVLLRLLVENVTGRPFRDEMRRLVLDPLGLADTRLPETDPDLPEPHARAHYRYEDEAGEQVTVDVTRQNPSWISTGGDVISTTKDLQCFAAGLLGGSFLPAALLAEMRTPEAKVGYGLGLFVQPVGEDGAVVLTHNGGMAGHAALLYATPDAGTILTASINYTDDAGLSMAVPFQQATGRLVDAVFGPGRPSS